MKFCRIKQGPEDIFEGLGPFAYFLDVALTFVALAGGRLAGQRAQVEVLDGVIIVRHLNKLPGGPAIYRGGGSIGIIGAARSAMLVGRDPADPSRPVLAVSKSNLAVRPQSIYYTLESAGEHVARVRWGEECGLTADDILECPAGPKKKGKPERCADDMKWLLQNGHWVGSVSLGAHPAGWSPAGTGDFNHDGHLDILWREAATNHVEAWLLSNA